MLILITASGPDKGQVHELAESSKTIVGREGQIVLNDRKASRRHIELACDDGQWFVRDLNSRHGTYHNHERISERTAVNDGDYLQCGKTVMVLASLDAGASRVQRAIGGASLVEPTPASSLEDDGKAPAPIALPTSLGRNTKLAVAASVAAGGLVIGSTAWILTQMRSEMEGLRQALDAQTTDTQTAVRAELGTLSESVDAVAAAMPDPDRPLLARLEPGQFAQLRNPRLNEVLDAVQLALERQGDAGPAVVQAAAAVGDQLASLNTSIDALQRGIADADEFNVNARLDALASAAADNQAALTTLADQLQAADTPGGGGGSLDAVIARLDLMPTIEQHEALTDTLTQLRDRVGNTGTDGTATPLDADALAQLQAASEQTAASLDELKTQLAQLAAGTPDGGNPELAASLDAVLERLNALPDTDAIAAAIAAQHAELNEQIAAVVIRLESMPDGESIAADLRALVAQAGNGPDAAPPESLADTLTAIQERLAVTDDISAKLDAITGRFDEQSAATIAAVEQAITGRAAAEDATDVAAALDALREALPDASLDASAETLTRIDESLAALQVRLDETANATTGQRAGLEQLLTAMHDLRLELPGQPESAAAYNDLVAAVDGLRETATQNSDLLAELTAAAAGRQSLLSVRDDLTTVATGQPLNEDWVAQTLIDILERLESINDAGVAGAPATGTPAGAAAVIDPDTLRDQLAEAIAAVRDSQDLPAGSDEQMQTILRAIDELPFEVYEQRMRQILSVVQDQAGPDLDAIRAVVREEIDRAESGDADPAATHSLSPAALDGDRGELTDLQEAFSLAFSTGQTMQVGGGIDPETGDPMPGRILNPADAYAAGHETWRDWYDADARAERARLGG